MSLVVHQLVWVDILSPLVLMVVTLLIIHPFLPLSEMKQNSIVIGYLCTYEWLNLLLQSRDSILPQRWHNCTQKCCSHKVQIPSVNCKVDILFSNHENGSPELWSHWIEWILRIQWYNSDHYKIAKELIIANKKWKQIVFSFCKDLSSITTKIKMNPIDILSENHVLAVLFTFGSSDQIPYNFLNLKEIKLQAAVFNLFWIY